MVVFVFKNVIFNPVAALKEAALSRLYFGCSDVPLLCFPARMLTMSPLLRAPRFHSVHFRDARHATASLVEPTKSVVMYVCTSVSLN